MLAGDRGIDEIVVDLAGGDVRSRTTIEGARPPITPEDSEAAAACVLEDERVRAALRARGVEDLDLVQVDVLPSGAFGHPLEAGHRFGRAVTYLRRDPSDNAYARPIEHLIAYVDLDAHRVMEVDDGERRPIPEADGDYRAGVVPPREDLRPFSLTQPEGVSFSVDGGEVRWHRWTLVPAIDPQEGLVLHDVRYDGRPGPLPRVVRRNDRALRRARPDAQLARVLRRRRVRARRVPELARARVRLPGRDHLPRRPPGRPCRRARRIANAICLHEEDAGLLWKHTDHATGHVETRRGRRFVVNAMATVGNYEYAFRWYLGLDGGIEIEVQLHGIVSTIALGNGRPLAGSNVVDRGLAAPHHQHMFCFRLDLDVDGTANQVSEIESERVPTGPDNPLGNAFRPRVTPLRTEGEARRDADEAADSGTPL